MTIFAVLLSFLCSCVVFADVLEGNTFNGPVYTWLTMGDTRLEIGFLIDRLTTLMMVVVTFVSLMVHIYTIGYMAEDPGYQRFFAYISLFTFSMLMLVMANNFLQLFFGWEAVGLVSYLLIGFWYTRDSAVYANLKAFLVNRVGDFGFMLGIALILATVGTLDYADVFDAAAAGQLDAEITLICILLFVGAMGKSAQFPLHVWLPDSMEGPTPISALIHAATMVTAGIFMVARMSPLYELSETARSVVLVIGAITALFMGLVALTQFDIKRVVAYSTLSQLGYMTAALGASAYSAAMFHLMTHAFFKAVLFLAAGSVIIALHHEQDMRRMGGLRKYMPLTYWTHADRRDRVGRHSGLRRLLLQGRDHRGGAPLAHAGRHLRLPLRAGVRVRHRGLHLPHGVHGVPRQAALRPAPSAARVAAGGHRAARPAGDPVGAGRVPDRRLRVRRLLRRQPAAARPELFRHLAVHRARPDLAAVLAGPRGHRHGVAVCT